MGSDIFATYLARFVDGYVECMLWSTTDNADDSGGEPLDKNYSADDIAPEAMAQIRTDCTTFLTSHWDDIDDPGQAGHDFWLTRNGHGAGFWDGDYPEDLGQRLTDACEAFGEVWPYVGDDGQVYL